MQEYRSLASIVRWFGICMAILVVGTLVVTAGFVFGPAFGWDPLAEDEPGPAAIVLLLATLPVAAEGDLRSPRA